MAEYFSVNDDPNLSGASTNHSGQQFFSHSTLTPNAVEFVPRQFQTNSNGYGNSRAENTGKSSNNGRNRQNYNQNSYTNARYQRYEQNRSERHNYHPNNTNYSGSSSSDYNQQQQATGSRSTDNYFYGDNFSNHQQQTNNRRPNNNNNNNGFGRNFRHEEPYQNNTFYQNNSQNNQYNNRYPKNLNYVAANDDNYNENYGGSRQQQSNGNGRNNRNNENRYDNSTTTNQSNNGYNDNRSNQKPKNNYKDNKPNKNNSRFKEKESKILAKCSQREKLIREIESFKLECLVCCEEIKPAQSVWSCINCYHILHLGCTKKWATSCKSEEGWRCPACQNFTKQIPREYYCFCGKVKNPEFNRSDLAHSCGEVCGKIDQCQHPCTQLCHPGPCPPCQASVVRACGCGRTQKTLQCSQKDEISCSSICDKLLNCYIHNCNEKCHIGACPQCDKKLIHTCFCEKENLEVDCTVENNDKLQFSCSKVCEKLLSCGNHKCDEICHDGSCKTCSMAPDTVTSCPCGKQAIVPGERTSCLDKVPTCKSSCNKMLLCRHLCVSKCHTGTCPPCNKTTNAKCRCGNMDSKVKCKTLSTRSDDILCKKRCTKLRSCAKHKCNQECCIDIDHICPIVCSKTLSCGKHKCDKPCHKGQCKACHRVSFDELTCDCGASIIYPPIPCGTKKPPCHKICSRQHQCQHEVFHTCHSDSECPVCVVLTTKYCYGKHEQRKTIPCYQSSFSCGLACSKPLPCGRHKCVKMCHEGSCFVEGEICKQHCTTLRSDCNHPCNAPCHDGLCPELPCKENVEVTCECGNRKQTRTCHDFSKDYRRIASAQLASSIMEMQRGGTVELSDILGPVKIKNNKTLDCNEECRLLERNRRLAIGLQIRNPEVSSKLQPNYSEYIKMWAKKDAQLVKNIHEKLTELVKLAKESKQKSRSYSFPSMNRDKRQLVHEMCSMFGVESIAYDAEPNRNIVATAERATSWLPSCSIMEIMQRENGQRRVYLPSKAGKV